MYLEHAAGIWRDFPELVPGVLAITGITATVDAGPRAAAYVEIAAGRLTGSAESEFPEIRAWRRVFSRMGLKPTQYRCASESLLRRLRQEGALPGLHPLVDLCNAVSAAFAIPVAALDLAAIAGGLEIRRGTGQEKYQAFGGQVEHPAPDEVIFADEAGNAHARRWTNRQSGLSAISPSTADALIIAEGVHATASADVPRLVAALAAELTALWGREPVTAVLTAKAPRFTIANHGPQLSH